MGRFCWLIRPTPLLIKSIGIPFFATTWVENDPFVVNGIKDFLFTVIVLSIYTIN